MRMRVQGKALGALVLAAAMLVVGGAGTLQAAEELKDWQITDAVDDALMEDAATPADFIHAKTDDGIVTLTGSVTTILAKQRAAELASTVKGVRGIVNRIDVVPGMRPDKEIEEDVEDALRWDAVTESWEIGASVDDGIVTLTGTVDSWQERELTERVVKGVRGVKGVDQEITIDYQTDRMDSEIREEIEAALRWDAYIDDALIAVDVDDGEVDLTGTVGSLAEKNRALRKAWVAGVKSVDNTDLEVKWWARDGRLRKDKYVPKSDAAIKDAINDALLYDPRVYSFEIDVKPDSGYVTLRGTVDNLKAKRAAAQVARSVVGVWSVDNKIKVQPGTPSDRRIESAIEDAMLRDPYVERFQIDAEVVNGIAYLYGDVDSFFEKAQADDVAARQLGVREVENFLTVNDIDATVYNPYADEWYLYDYDWYVTTDRTTTKSDWEIREDIRDELFWSPFVDADQVDVRVNDGVAELTGTVDTWAEREAATENALEGGAVVVDNDLAVRYGPDYYEP